MSYLNSILTRTLAASALVFTLASGNALGENAYPVFTDLNAEGLGFGLVDIFDDTGFADWDESGVYQGNDILVATMVGGPDFAGIGISVPVSNGENGITSTDGGLNVDIDNVEPVNPAIASVNGGGKLSNGNIIRASVWMRSDPNNPATGVGTPGAASMPQVEGIFKIELYKEALSTFADFDGPGDSDYGDRIWDQDQQGGDGAFADINGDGFSGGFGAPVTVTLNTESWTQMVVEYEVDDTPEDPGNTFSPWNIGFEAFTVADVEDIRAVFFAGDFTGATNFDGGGSWWMDNMLIEVFADQAAADAVDPTSTNPAPIESASDFDGDGDVDGADFLGIQQFDPGSIAAWQADYPTAPPVSGLSAVPEPSSAALVLLSMICFGGAQRRRSR